MTGLVLLLIANCIFYALLDLKSLPVLIAVSVLTWLGGRMICAKRQKDDNGTSPKRMCIAFIAVLVLILCFFKYSHIIALPIGMSFYMLMAIGFLADCSRGEFASLPSLPETLAYVSFFPTVISGPILKAKEFIPQLSSPKKLNRDRLTNGLWLIVIGLFMKFVCADRLAVCVDKVYATPLVYSGLTLFAASVSYTLQLLFDFAGYSNMATGAACIIGFDIMPNFNLPYIATNPSEFWRRWHISLSSWLKDYVYIPLGGSRKGTARTYINIMLVMIVSGLWHGSTVNFLIWGILHGIGQVVWRAFTGGKKKDANSRPAAIRILSIFINFLFVNFLWIPFRAQTLPEAWTIFTRIVTFSSGAAYYYVYTFIFAAMLVVVELIGILRNSGNNPIKPLPFDKMYSRVIFFVVIIATAMFAYFGNGAFIYSQF